MREYKFRAWDKIKKKMYSWEEIDEDNELLYRILHYQFFNGLASMQYIGLYDLYEDDIIELENWNPKRYVIKFIEGAFCIADIKTGEYVADIHYIHHAGKVQYKTIGNIYKNPELLK